MIFVCEPTCRGSDHERVNSGFAAALARANPEQAVRLYAERGHCRAVEDSLFRDNVRVGNLQFETWSLPRFAGRASQPGYLRMFRQVFGDAVQEGVDKIYVLSFDLEALWAIKQLKRRANFRHLKFALVVHGLFESIVDGDGLGKIAYPIRELPHRSLVSKLGRASPRELPGMLSRGLRAAAMRLPVVRSRFGPSGWVLRDLIEMDHSSDFRYVLLAPHATRNAARYLAPPRFDLFTVTMPVHLMPPSPAPQNDHAKIAVYGNADALAIHNIGRALETKRPRARYEIRIIGGNHFGAEGLSNMTRVGRWGTKLTRQEMEASARDIDVFLILNDRTKYRVTCSGVLFEALSLMKPMIYFESECFNQFDTEETPIGVRCHSFEQCVDTLIEFIDTHAEQQPRLERFRQGILRRREALSCEESAVAVKRSFEW